MYFEKQEKKRKGNHFFFKFFFNFSLFLFELSKKLCLISVIINLIICLICFKI